ncbi:hypothetical protein PVAP13_8KG290500 [Panicum virgatum]|uniref:F-box domain-containing protein n=1 Tax=Panicum virgatum TaxID=38727 RepID=A0A8T0PXN6_PANVG|nr:hypothetical protein PVAP13_8KG290500 [Panicum virgatum]
MSLRHLFLRAFSKFFLSSSPSLLKADVSESRPELPVDILMDIFALLEIPDLLRAGAVCSTWHAAPCLLYTSESDADNVACLYNLAEDRVYRLTLPELAIRSRYLIGSSNGWLVTADERSELHMVNPITGEQIALPPVTTIEQVKPILDDAGEIKEYELSHFSGEEVFRDPTILALNELRDDLYFKAFVFPDEASSGSYIVVLIHQPYELSFARTGDPKWTLLAARDSYEDCMYVEGVLYAVTGACRIDAFDLTGPTNLRKVIMEETKNFILEHIYITKTSSGDLLLVWREQDVKGEGDVGEDAPETDLSEIKMETRKITLYKVDMEAKQLVEINRLHDHVLFLGYSQTYCLGAEEYPSLKANHAYLTDSERHIAFWKRNCRDICVFNLESNSAEEIVLPQCWCSWPAPIWKTPNLTMSSRLRE